MIVTFLRSSSIGSYKLCPMQYLMDYSLKLPSLSNKSAVLGNVVHKALETLAWVSYWTARNVDEFEDETFGMVRCSLLTPEECCHRAYLHYRRIEPTIRWKDRSGEFGGEADRDAWRLRLEQGVGTALDLHLPKSVTDKNRPRGWNDYDFCQWWTLRALAWDGGAFDPRNQNVIQAEQKFDFIIDEPWARYSYETPEGILEGQLGIKGTMDLIVAEEPDGSVISVNDYKTGHRKDWGESDDAKAVKSYDKLMDESQLLLYFLATSRLYPDVKCILVNIIYINDGGAFTLAFGPRDIERAKDMLRRVFEEIRETQYPVAKVGKPCYTFCSYGTRSVPKDSDEMTTCRRIMNLVREKGADQVLYEIGNIGAISAYGQGGGRQ